MTKWKLVPVEPTPEMYSASRLVTESEGITTTTWLRSAVYRAMIEAAPTPAEAPAQDFEDALEQAFWDFDARHKGYKKTIRPISERDAFKQVLRNFMHEHGGAEAPADVVRDAELLSKLRHSIRQAMIPGNNWRQELALMEGAIYEAIERDKLKGDQS